MKKFELKPSGKRLQSIDDISNTSIKEIIEVNKDNSKKSKPTFEETQEKRKDSRYYLPVLHLNDMSQWESKKMSERKHFTDDVAKNTCLGNCCGVEGLRAGCCQMDPDDLEHVLGPIDEDWIKSTIKWYAKKNIVMTRHDIVIDHEEGRMIGRTFFNSHPVFDTPESYPILRMQVTGIRMACKFVNPSNGKCTIYEVRPKMCRKYYCSYIKSNFLVRLPESPNTFRKLT